MNEIPDFTILGAIGSWASIIGVIFAILIAILPQIRKKIAFISIGVFFVGFLFIWFGANFEPIRNILSQFSNFVFSLPQKIWINREYIWLAFIVFLLYLRFYKNAHKEEEKIPKAKESRHWSAPQKSRVTWDKCGDNDLLHKIDVPDQLPYTLSFDIEPRYKDRREHGNLWRAGIVFVGDNNLDARLLFHTSWENDKSVWVHIYVGYPIVSGVHFKKVHTVDRFQTGSDRLRLQVCVRHDRVILRAGSRAWWFKEGALHFEPKTIGTPCLLSWCDDNVTEIDFRNISIKQEDSSTKNLIDDLCDASHYSPIPFKSIEPFEDDFSNGLGNAWVLPARSRDLKIDSSGLQLPPFDEINGNRSIEEIKPYINVPLLEKIPYFMNGAIECEVSIPTEAIFNVVFRGSITRREFYMARLDTRIAPSYRDCILIKEEQENHWRTIAVTKYKSKTPADTWVKMRIEAIGTTISLFRDERLVYEVDNVYIRPSMIGLLAEEKTVSVRSVKLFNL